MHSFDNGSQKIKYTDDIVKMFLNNKLFVRLSH